MKAVVYESYGSPEVLQLREVEKPAPGDNEILIKIHATAVTAGDWRARSLELPVGFGFMGRLVFGISGPRKPILGTEFGGVVESAGKMVSRFQSGDQVCGFTGFKMGCYAEYTCMPEDGAVVEKPPNLSFGEAAALGFGGTTAVDFLRRGDLQAGETALINRKLPRE